MAERGSTRLALSLIRCPVNGKLQCLAAFAAAFF